MSHSQKGFTLIEALLILAVLVIIGSSGYLFMNGRSKHGGTTDSTVSQSSQSKPSGNTAAKAPKSTNQAQTYVTIKEWGVRAPYNGNLTLTYAAQTSHTMGFTATQLVALNPECTPMYGGAISRYAPNEDASDEGNGSLTAKQRADESGKGNYAYVGGYYYFFGHAQSLCPSDDPKVDNAAVGTMQSQANDDVKNLLGSLEAIPQ